MRCVIALVFVVSCVGAAGLGCSKPSQGLDPDKIISVAENDEEMNAAMAEARRTLSGFRERMANPTPAQSLFSVKVAFTDARGTEYFWTSDLKADGDGFTGEIGNEPQTVACVKLGEKIRIKPEQVSDWMYVEDGKVVGNYTLRVLLKHMSPEEAADAKRMCGWD